LDACTHVGLPPDGTAHDASPSLRRPPEFALADAGGTSVAVSHRASSASVTKESIEGAFRRLTPFVLTDMVAVAVFVGVSEID